MKHEGSHMNELRPLDKPEHTGRGVLVYCPSRMMFCTDLHVAADDIQIQSNPFGITVRIRQR